MPEKYFYAEKVLWNKNASCITGEMLYQEECLYIKKAFI